MNSDTVNNKKSLVISEVSKKISELTSLKFAEVIAEHLESRDDYSKVEIFQNEIYFIKTKASSPTGEFLNIFFFCIFKKKLSILTLKNILKIIDSENVDEAVIVTSRKLSLSENKQIDELKKSGIRVAFDQWVGEKLIYNLVEKTPFILLRRFVDLFEVIPFVNKNASYCPSFEYVVPPLEIDSELNADKFFNGFPPNWQNLLAGHDIKRKDYILPGGIKEKVLNALNEANSFKTFALIGVAGTGKTTLLRRIGMDAALEGYIVLLLEDEWEFYNLSLSKQIKELSKRANSPILILIDDASELVINKNVLEKLINELMKIKSVVLVLAEQPIRWENSFKRISSFIKGGNYFNFWIHNLFQDEIEELVDKILEYEKNKTLAEPYCDLSREERLELCIEIARRQFVVAMLQMRHGMRFKNIIEREYDRILIKEGKDGYSLVCYFNTFGITIPLTLLIRALNIKEPIKIQKFIDSTNSLFIKKRRGLCARHSIIANTIVKHALSSPEAKKTAMYKILSSVNLNIENKEEEDIFVRFFTDRNMHKRIVIQLNRDCELLRDLYREIKENKEIDKYFLKFLYTSQAMAEKVLKNMEKSRLYFEQAIELDDKFAFAHLQYAWLEHDEGRWMKAAERAMLAADLATYDFLCQFYCARILSLNTVKNFQKAKKFYNRALDLAPDDFRLQKSWENYQVSEKVLSYLLSGLEEDAILPDYVYNYLRPGLSFIQNVHGLQSKKVKSRLKSELRRMEEKQTGKVTDVYEKVGGTDVENNPAIKASIYCNIARIQYIEWYHKIEEHDSDQIENLFKKSLDIVDHDPLTHCWYGTFLKEVRNNFEGAWDEYKKARDIGNNMKKEYYHEHPLFLNNIALLIMEEVETGRKSKESLIEAKKNLEIAVRRVEELKSGFIWAEESLSRCERLIENYN